MFVVSPGVSNTHHNKPRHPSFSIHSKRKATFQRYPPNGPIEVDKLCDAGFIYLGQGDDDTVRCFWCDGALDKWERGDDPWVEHAKYVDF